jgi:hypothetical protein
VVIAGVVIVSTPLVPYQWQLTGNAWAVIFPLTVVLGCHILFPVSIPFPLPRLVWQIDVFHFVVDCVTFSLYVIFISTRFKYLC